MPWDLEQDTNCLFFVDDGTLCTSTPTMMRNVSILKRSIELLADYFLKIGIHIEPTKTELMHFTAFDLSKGPCTFKHKCQLDLFFNVAGVTHCVQPKGVWRYLGFFFDSFLKFHHHVRYYTNKAFSTIRACGMLGNSRRGLSPRNRTLAYIQGGHASGFNLWTGIVVCGGWERSKETPHDDEEGA